MSSEPPRLLARFEARQRRWKRGTTIFLLLFAILVLLITAAMSIDVAYMQLTRTQLRSATDAATRAGCAELSFSQNESSARQAAKDAAALNYVAGQPLKLADNEIVFGKATVTGSGVWTFKANSKPYNGVQVLGNRTSSSLSGSVNLFLGKLVSRGQFEPTMTATAAQLNRDLALVIDRSGSMNTADVGGGLTRWEALKNAVNVFLDTLGQTPKDEQFALASYSTDATIDMKLNQNTRNLKNALDKQTPLGWTNIGGGIDQGIAILNDPKAHRAGSEKTLILMTDGLHNIGTDPLEAAQRAVDSDIIIHAITFSPAADQARMKTVAAMTGGQHFHADTSADLSAIYREIALGTPVLLIK